jgi:DNA-binding CsgD family transcriptional regulator
MMPRERLTPREVQVAILVWEGLTNREIGKIVGTTEQVIKNHLRSTFDKLGVWSRLELAMYVASHGGKNWPEDAETEPIVDRQIVDRQIVDRQIEERQVVGNNHAGASAGA